MEHANLSNLNIKPMVSPAAINPMPMYTAPAHYAPNPPAPVVMPVSAVPAAPCGCHHAPVVAPVATSPVGVVLVLFILLVIISRVWAV